MSTNEELAQAIQDGHSEAVGVLWEQVEKFTRQQARRYWNGLTAATIEIDDLVQVGFFALMDAVAGFDPDKGAFLTYYGHQLHHHFSECAGLHSQRQRREAATVSVLSLDKPLDATDSGSNTIGDLIADPSATMETAEEAVFRQQLHEAAETVLGELSPQHSQIIRQRFYEGKTLSVIAQEQGTTPEMIRQREAKALRELRKPRNAARLRSFYDFDFYHGVGLGAFRQTGMSVQERYLLLAEKKRGNA